MTVAALSALLTFAVAPAMFQDTPVEIPKKELPKKAVCVVCAGMGETHGEERPAGGMLYKGQRYFFCAANEAKEFAKDPEGYLPPVLPRPAPALDTTDLSGKKVTLADFRGKVVLLDFWATWCKPCVASMPALSRIAARWKDQGLEVVGVSVDQEPAKVAPFLKKKPVPYTILLDNPKAPSYGTFRVKVLPSVFLIDREGNIVAQWKGETKTAEFEQAIERLVK
ncbi:MAG: redoxin domain-containing protein [Armatimonadaceae bacterium]